MFFNPNYENLHSPAHPSLEEKKPHLTPMSYFSIWGDNYLSNCIPQGYKTDIKVKESPVQLFSTLGGNTHLHFLSGGIILSRRYFCDHVANTVLKFKDFPSSVGVACGAWLGGHVNWT